ncbi:MAG: hypothetical protein ACYS17_14030, partial [Planctomycetota bacterium]
MHRIFYTLVFIGLLSVTTDTLCNLTLAASKDQQKYIKVPVKRKPTDSQWKLRDTRTIELLDSFQPDSKKITYNQYGGRADCKAEAKGYFYPKKLADRWWLIDPKGNLYINVGVCSIRRGKSKISRKPAMEKFGTWEKWAEFTTSLLAKHG